MKKRAFTLIELLVVVVVIGILASIVAVNLVGARKKARDAQRIANVKQVDTALGLYYVNNSHFPGVAEGITGGLAHYWFGYSTATGGDQPPWIALGTALQPYLSPMPKDPDPAKTWGMRYCVHVPGNNCSTTTKYEFASSLETPTGNGVEYLAAHPTDIDSASGEDRNLCNFAGYKANDAANSQKYCFLTGK